MRITLICACMVALLGGSSTAFADDKEAARLKFQQGIAAFGESRFEEAVQAFREADRLFASWKLQYNIGQCEAALKHYGLAIEAFERYLAQGGDEVPTERRDEVLTELDRMRKMVGDVEVDAPAGVVVAIDGTDRGETPLPAPIRVTAGVEHEVVLTRDGQELERRKVIVGGGQRTVVELGVEPVEPQEQSPAETGPSEPVEDGTEDEGGLSPVAFWVGLGATVAFGATTVALHFATDGKIDDIESSPDDDGLRDQGKAMQKAGIAFMVLTGVAAVTTGVLAGLTDFGGDEEQPADAEISLAPWSDGEAGGLGLTGRF